MHYIFLLLFLFVLLPLDFTQIDKRYLLLLSIILLSAFASIYSQTGSIDYPGYESYFECISIPECAEDLVVEPSFKLIVNVFQGTMGTNFWLFISTYSVLAIVIKLYFLKKYSPFFMLSVLVYVCYNFLIHDMTQVRAALSLAFFWLAVDKYSENSLKKSFVFFMLAVVLHASAVAGGVIYFLNKRTLNKAFFFFVVIFAYAISFIVPKAPFLALVSDAFPGTRLSVYAAGFGVELWDFNAINMTVFIFFIMNSLLLFRLKEGEASEIEVIVCKLGFVAVAAFGATYWVPALGMRTFEYLNSLYVLTFVFVVKNYRNAYMYLFVLGAGFFYWANNLINHQLMLDFSPLW